MKKLSVFLIPPLILLISLLACSVSSGAGSVPVIALTYVPAYGEKAPFQGIVFTEDGSAFDPSAYRISLYLQITEGGTYYVKPTYDTPYAVVAQDGSFSVTYVTGGVDEQAQILHLMLIPSSYTPGASYAETKNVALDYVKVTRTQDKDALPVVAPNRQPPTLKPGDIAPAMPSGLLPVSRDKIALDLGLYTNGGAAGSALSADLVRQHLDAVSDFCDTVRFYGSAGELDKAYKIAHDMGFAVLGNAWLDRDKASNQTELDALIEHCNKGHCKIAIVGSEVLLRGDLTAGELVEAIQYVRERLTDKTIPVTTADSVDKLRDTPSVRNACNLLLPNCYPYWGGSDIEHAAEHFIDNMKALEAVSSGKEILVSETGWPTAGQGNAGDAAAAQYYAAIREWSLSGNTQILYFASADEPWKASTDEGEAGAHWGFMTTALSLKDCYRNLNPFQEKYAIAYTGSDGTSATATLTNNTGTSVEISYCLAAYNAAGRMLSCNVVSKSLNVAESVPLTVTHAGGGTVSEIRAFVLDAATFAPLRAASVKKVG
ncbi:MAG: hypothetical protein IJR72_04565 [Oscillospiraceae bacterium]|nr:hypothetical protein [Oscillospiraceae bacterium]